jgi:hypothetical protein
MFVLFWATGMQGCSFPPAVGDDCSSETLSVDCAELSGIRFLIGLNFRSGLMLRCFDSILPDVYVVAHQSCAILQITH